MAYLGNARKEDLRLLAEELNLNCRDFSAEFCKNQRDPAQSWHDFVFEITSYFEEWIGGLGVNDFEGLKNLMTTDQLKWRVPGDVREQFVDNWVKSSVPGDLADKARGIRKHEGHLARECPKNTRKTPPCNARSNIITAKGTELEFTKEVVTARVSIPVSVPINTRNGIDDLQLVDIKCGQTSIKAAIVTGAQISVLREDLIGKGCGEGEGTIQIISAFGEKKIATLKPFNLKIDDGKHGSVPIMCAVSKKLINDVLISATAYEILLEIVNYLTLKFREIWKEPKINIYN
ncbi:retrovirus-related Pol polyprotein from transposon opus [Trichonephila clavipes]|nr:retrovirus-related Pol polyprotein from transposon opus [Trichonephila clavipes]